MNIQFDHQDYCPKGSYAQQQLFQFIEEGDRPINDGQNRIYYGEVHEYYSTEVFRNFSIKIPVQGTMHYKTQQREFDLQPNTFLLTYRQPGKLVIDSSILVKSVSIDIKQETIEDALNTLRASGNYDLEDMKANYFFSTDFFENIYPLGTKLEEELNIMVHKLLDNTLVITQDTFLTLAEKVALHTLGNYKSLNNLHSIRSGTRKEILKRLLKGKEFIDANSLGNPDMEEVIKQSNMSEFHFFRSFKQAFGYSPAQYKMKKRLEHATILINKDEPVTMVALECGFPNLFAFSKAFKKAYGTSPSSYKNKASFKV